MAKLMRLPCEGTLSILNDADDDSSAYDHHINQFTFSDGTSLSRSEFLAATAGTLGDDIFNGSGRSDTYTIGAGQGDDTITLNSSNHLEVDKLLFEDGLTLDDIYAADEGGNLKIQFGNAEGSLTIVTPSLDVKHVFDEYVFSDGTTFNHADFSAQALTNALNYVVASDDDFVGTNGNDVFHTGYNQGDDTISSNSARYQEVDTLQFAEGITVADVYSTYDSVDLVVGFKAADGTITILHDGDNDSYADKHQINRFTFTDGTSFTRQEFLAETLGTVGNDAFDGSGENDTFIVRAGQGDDTITSSSSHYLEVDTLAFEDGVTAADVYSTYNGVNLVVGFRNAEGTVTILHDGDNDSNADDHQINQFTFSDGTTLNRVDFLAATAGTAGDDTLDGSGENDTFTVGANQGDDTITLNSSNHLEVDKLLFEDGLTLDDTYVVYDGADLVIRFANAEGSVTIVNGGPNVSNGHKYQFNEYVFADGTSLNHEDFAVSGLRNALNYVPVTDDALVGSNYDDTYYVTVNHGDDTINSNSARYQEVDTIEFQEGITVADVYSTYDGVNLVVGFKAADGTVTILHDGDNDSNADDHQINRFTFTDGTSFTREEFMVATLGTAGDDAFNGSGENDTFILRAGQGDDTIGSHSSHYLEVDTLTFEDGVTAADLYSTYDGTSFVIGFKDASGTISILRDGDNDSNADDHQINRFTFSDGASLSRQEFMAATLGTSGDDAFNGSGESDTFVAGIGSGHDKVSSYSSNYLEVDVLEFKDGLAVADVFSFREDVDGNGRDDLVIGFDGNTEDTITILDALSSSSSVAGKSKINEYKFEDGTTLSQADFIAATLDQTQADDFVF